MIGPIAIPVAARFDMRRVAGSLGPVEIVTPGPPRFTARRADVAHEIAPILLPAARPLDIVEAVGDRT